MASIFERSPVSMDPPLPVYFFNVVSGLRDKSAKGYPVKKVLIILLSFLFLIPSKLLLVLWKTILSCCGGFRDLERVKKVSRELAGLAPIPEEGMCRIRVVFSTVNHLERHSHPYQIITVRYGGFPRRSYRQISDFLSSKPRPLPPGR